MDTQFEWMVSTAHTWADKVRSGHLPRHLTWQAWQTTILKTLEYPLPSTTLSCAQCSKLNSIVAQAALPRCGIVRTFPRDLLHAPLKIGGLNIPDLYVEQGIAHLSKLIHYSKSPRHTTGLLLRQTCEALKLELGTNGFLFSNSLRLLPLVTNGWIKSTWKFAQEYCIQIQDDIPDFQPRRVNDILLIPLFDRLGFSPTELQRINQCRLFLKISWLSEIVTGDGLYIEKSALEPPYRVHVTPEYRYPEQTEPPACAWKIWTTAISAICDYQRRLRTRLGPYVRRDLINWW
jgi:hypothetical protein